MKTVIINEEWAIRKLDYGNSKDRLSSSSRKLNKNSYMSKCNDYRNNSDNKNNTLIMIVIIMIKIILLMIVIMRITIIKTIIITIVIKQK